GPVGRSRGRGLDRDPPRHVPAAGRPRGRRGLRRRGGTDRLGSAGRDEFGARVIGRLSSNQRTRPDARTGHGRRRLAGRARADIVVVGAGTIGGWASAFLAEGGAGRVVVVERGLVGQGASSRAAGI